MNLQDLINQLQGSPECDSPTWLPVTHNGRPLWIQDHVLAGDCDGRILEDSDVVDGVPRPDALTNATVQRSYAAAIGGAIWQKKVLLGSVLDLVRLPWALPVFVATYVERLDGSGGKIVLTDGTRVAETDDPYYGNKRPDSDLTAPLRQVEAFGPAIFARVGDPTTAPMIWRWVGQEGK